MPRSNPLSGCSYTDRTCIGTFLKMSFSYLTEKKQPSNLVELCLGAALKYNKPDALNSKRGSEWHSIGASEFAQRVVNVASGLKELGIQAGDRIALLSENRPEWSIVDLAIAAVGAVNVPIYT